MIKFNTIETVKRSARFNSNELKRAGIFKKYTVQILAATSLQLG